MTMTIIPLVGTWYVETTHYPGTDFEYSEYVEITYKKDGTVTGYCKEKYKNGKEIVETDSGRYKVIKNDLCIWWLNEDEDAGEPWPETFSINGNKMTTSESEETVWTRK